MKKNKWYELFNKKTFFYNLESKKVPSKPYELYRVIVPNVTKNKFKLITQFISKKINFENGEKILDFGSGNGSFLLYFQKKAKKMYSIDISKPLLNIQKKYLKNTVFIPANPNNINFFKKIKNNEIDVTISTSVFQCFDSEQYCKQVLREMIRITKKVVFIYDLKNKNKKKLYINNARVKQNLTVNEFKKKYRYTPYKFFDKTFFRKFISSEFPQKKFEFFDLPNAQEDSKFGFCLKIYS
jgi:ubiquinone/menaquinone biosynthesis C-methylase UbiE|tara:strand:- start:333 stop:1052 length:720 start_codon:yes stop_codon:yes gene_type:complete